jgi:seryl-tRNA synthetase
MLDIKFIRENVELVREAIAKKRLDLDLDKLLKLDEERRSSLLQQETLRARQNEANNVIVKAAPEDKKRLIAEMKEVSNQIAAIKDQLVTTDQEFRSLMLRVPQIPADNVHVGGEEDNKVIKTVGEPTAFDFEIKDHVTLGKDLDIIDIERGVKLMGTRGYVLKNEGARLEQALINYALDFLRERGFTQLTPPVLAQGRFLEGTGHFPFGQDEVFKVFDQRETDEAKLYLIGTSEVPLTGYHADEILDPAQLPIKYTAATNCFRTEVGSYGKDTQGLYRVKQFVKIEQVVIAKADDKGSAALLREILANAEEFVTSLELPYRVLQIATGDMGAAKVEMFDLECWMPSRAKYGETHSASNLGDWQARRLNIRYADGKNNLVCHTLNNTLMASPRLLIPLLENHQKADGSITIPQVLRPYMNGLAEIKPKA